MSQGIQLPGDNVKIWIQVYLTWALSSAILFLYYFLEEKGVERPRTNR